MYYYYYYYYYYYNVKSLFSYCFDAAKLDPCQGKIDETSFGCLWDDYLKCPLIRTALESNSKHPAKLNDSHSDDLSRIGRARSCCCFSKTVGFINGFI